MHILFSNAKKLGVDVWEADFDHAAIRLSKSAPRQASRTVILVDHVEYSDNLIQVPLNSMNIVTLGATGAKAIIVLGKDKSTEREITMVPREEVDCSRGGSFSEFIHESLKHGLSKELIGSMERLLTLMKESNDFKLVEGKARKWTAEPNNFLAVTIQNRNKQYLISVRGYFKNLPNKTIRPVRGRGDAYSEFAFSDIGQFDEALHAIRESANS